MKNTDFLDFCDCQFSVWKCFGHAPQDVEVEWQEVEFIDSVVISPALILLQDKWLNLYFDRIYYRIHFLVFLTKSFCFTAQIPKRS